MEGVFALPPGLPTIPSSASCASACRTDAEELVLARRVAPRAARAPTFRAARASVADLRELGGALLVLLRAARAPPAHARLRAARDRSTASAGRSTLARARGLRGRARAGARARAPRWRSCVARAGARDRELDLLAFEIEEIEALGAEREEEDELLARARAPARSSRGCARRRAGGRGARAGGRRAPGVGARCWRGAERAGRRRSAGADPAARRARRAAARAAHRGRGPRRGAAPLRGGARGRARAGSRRSRSASTLYDRLKRKHGGSVAAVLAHAERCRAERDAARGRRGGAGAEVEAALRRGAARTRTRWPKRSAHARAGGRAALAEAVLERARRAGDGGRRLRGRARAARGAARATGAERVEFVIAPNPGVAAGAAARDRLGRRALARDARADERRRPARRAAATLVFDEVDAGIGGQTARVVGEKLRGLADGRQVLCITHLPQIASLAERHFSIEKEQDGKVARATSWSGSRARR